jgi:hypothetical protein
MAPGSADINFDEFQAIRRRKAQDDEEDEDTKEEPAATPKAEEEEPDGLAERAGAFAELPEVQLLLCVAILADVAGAAVTAARDDGAPAFLVRAAAAFPGFVNFLYAFELLALATAFKLRMLTHPGLLLDVGIVSARHRRPLFFRRVDGVMEGARRVDGVTGDSSRRARDDCHRSYLRDFSTRLHRHCEREAQLARDDAVETRWAWPFVSTDGPYRLDVNTARERKKKKTKKTKHRPSSPPTPKATPTRSDS